jgi:hypothetical protein
MLLGVKQVNVPRCLLITFARCCSEAQRPPRSRRFPLRMGQALVVQNGNEYDEGLLKLWDPIKFFCANERCPRRFLTEPLPGMLTRYARRSCLLRAVGFPRCRQADRFVVIKCGHNSQGYWNPKSWQYSAKMFQPRECLVRETLILEREGNLPKGNLS